MRERIDVGSSGAKILQRRTHVPDLDRIEINFNRANRMRSQGAYNQLISVPMEHAQVHYQPAVYDQPPPPPQQRPPVQLPVHEEPEPPVQQFIEQPHVQEEAPLPEQAQEPEAMVEQEDIELPDFEDAIDANVAAPAVSKTPGPATAAPVRPGQKYEIREITTGRLTTVEVRAGDTLEDHFARVATGHAPRAAKSKERSA